MNDFVAGPLFTPSPGVSYGPGPMNNTGRWTPNGLPGSSWDNPFGNGFQMPAMGGLMQPQPMQPMGQEFDPGYGGGGSGGGGSGNGDQETEQERIARLRAEREARAVARGQRFDQQHTNGSLASRSPMGAQSGSLSSRKARPVNTMGFGGAFANGGIAPAGKVSLVGERGPEWIIPSGPTQVMPMAPDNRYNGPLSGRGPMGAQGGPLSMRGPTPTGRGMTPERRMKIAERSAVRNGDQAGAANWARSAQWASQFNQQQGMPMMPQQPMQMPMAPAQPTGKLVSGRSAGSMVWQPNAPPMMPQQEPAPQPPMQRGGESAQFPAPEMPMMPQSNPLDGGNPLGPLQLPPPRYNMTRVGGRDILEGPDGKYLNAFNAPPQAGWMNQPDTNLLIPTMGGERNPGLPMFEVNPQTIEGPRTAPGMMGPGAPKVQPKITPVQDSKPAALPDGIKYVTDPVTGQVTGGYYPRINEQGKVVITTIDLDGNGVISPAEKAAAAGAAAPAGGAPRMSGQTPSGVTFKLKGAPDAPGTSMGQLPTANHSAPLHDSPSASLSDANASYRNSGYADDAALRQHFANYPSAAVQAYTQQQQQDMAEQDTRRAAQAQEDALSQAAEAGRRSRVGILPTMVEGMKRGVPELIGDVSRAAPVVAQKSAAAIKQGAIQASKLVNLPAAADALLGDKRKTKAELEYEQFLEWKAKNKK